MNSEESNNNNKEEEINTNIELENNEDIKNKESTSKEEKSVKSDKKEEEDKKIKQETDNDEKQSKKKKKKKNKNIPPNQNNSAKKELTPEEIEKFKESSEKIKDDFIEYYRQLLFMSKQEFETFLQYTVKELPITFRISKISPYCDYLDLEINTILTSNENIYNSRVKRFKFNFLDNIYQIDKLSKDIESDNQIKSILIRENETGILRQELVAMVPLNLVDIKDDDIILDLCASPGNKTVQALEIMQEKARQYDIMPRGVIIANDIEPDRVSNMGHFFKKQFPTNIVTVNSPGEKLPIIKDPNYRPNLVICDVPCSGDGTLRKNKGLRRRWKMEIGYQNHPIQIKLLDAAVNQCKEDGYIIYSTCAINPIENESVVLNILEKYKDQIELVNVTNKLKEMNLKFTEGLVRWKVCCNWDNPEKLEWANSYNTIENKYKEKISLIRPSMFNEIYTKKNFDSNIFFSDPYQLRKCVRLYSHQNDTGSFFIAVIHKLKHVKSKNEIYSVPLNEKKMKTIGEDLDDFLESMGLERESDKEKPIEQIKDALFETQIPPDEIKKETKKENNDDSVIFKKYENIKKFEASYKNLNEIFKLKNDMIDKFLFCKRETSHKIYLFSEKLAQMINLLSNMNINIIKSGLAVFKHERQELNTKYRLTYYGAILLEQYLGNQILELKRPDLLKLMFEDKDYNIQFKNIPNEEKEIIDKFENGSVILIYDTFVLICRKGKNLLALYLPGQQFASIKKYFMESINSK